MHTLKGLAATLGALALKELAAAAEARFREPANEEDEARLSDVVVGLATASAVLLGVADTLDPPSVLLESDPADPERILEYLDELDALLAERNMRALDVFASLKHEAGSTFADSLQALDAALYHLDFAVAREKAANLKGILK